jgi:predicted small secreted protein
MIVLGLALAACVCACSTTEGFGNDVKHLGGDIEGSAARNK